MKRGFPRPRTFVGLTHSNPYKKFSGWAGSYGRNWDYKEYPHPYTAADESVAAIDEGRRKETVYFKRCGTCGLPVEEDLVGLILTNERARKGEHKDWLHSESGPYHLKCLTLNFVMCPHLAKTAYYMPAVALWSDVRQEILGYQ